VIVYLRLFRKPDSSGLQVVLKGHGFGHAVRMHKPAGFSR